MLLSLLLPLLALPQATATPLLDRTYDYVIVGGGTAGLTLAHRLSANPAISVAVVEAGTHYQVSNLVFSSTPGADALFVGSDPKDSNPLVDWDIVTTPQAGARGREIHYARGKCLGGSSARNFMIYQRPDSGSLDVWADLVGDDSYRLANWMPYYRRSVDFTAPTSPPREGELPQYDAGAYDASAGPLQVSYSNYAAPWSEWLSRGLTALGIPKVADMNSGSILGHTWTASTIDPAKQQRSSSQTAFYSGSTVFRRNLKVHQLTHARRIMFEGKRAAAVEVNSGAKLHARREVIVSAGAFQSPQLLMVSGVGPAAQLAQHGIPVVADRPGVGQNMSDHAFAAPSYRVKVDTYTRLGVSVATILWEFFANFSRKRGVLTNPIADYFAFERLDAHLPPTVPADVRAQLAAFPPSWPHIEYVSAPGHIGRLSNLRTDQPKDGYQYASVLVVTATPLSRGNVTLRSSSMADLPLVNPNWGTHPADQAALVAGYKRARELFASDAIRPVLADAREYFPGPQVQTDEQILGAIQDSLMTLWHAACTCRMGRADDPSAVVDSRARVIGVEGLRVVDASAFALLPPGHPQSVVYALAEKIADDILADWA